MSTNGKIKRVRRKVAAKAIREKNVATLAKKTAKWAIKKASDNNVSVTVARKGHIYRLHPDGRKERMTALPGKVRVIKQIIRIGG